MDESTKVVTAVERELEEMRNALRQFDVVIAEAQVLAKDCRISADRAEAALRELELDRVIERADRLLKRGPYVELRVSPEIRGKVEMCDACGGTGTNPEYGAPGEARDCPVCDGAGFDKDGPTEYVGLKGFAPSNDGRRSWFATFGTEHRHVVKFGTTELVLDGECYVEIFAICEEAARAFMFEKFGRQWCTTYAERPVRGVYDRECVYQVALPVSYGEEKLETTAGERCTDTDCPTCYPQTLAEERAAELFRGDGDYPGARSHGCGDDCPDRPENVTEVSHRLRVAPPSKV
jgi:hypothetical protein